MVPDWLLFRSWFFLELRKKNTVAKRRGIQHIGCHTQTYFRASSDTGKWRLPVTQRIPKNGNTLVFFREHLRCCGTVDIWYLSRLIYLYIYRLDLSNIKHVFKCLYGQLLRVFLHFVIRPLLRYWMGNRSPYHVTSITTSSCYLTTWWELYSNYPHSC